MEFTSFFSLLSFITKIGEQGALYETKPGIRKVDNLVAAGALYETLFSKKTIG
jgi:hypothetical protein